MRTIVAASILVLAAGCGEQAPVEVADAPNLLTRNEVCMLDGMILLDYPGPKGQVFFKNGEAHYFCDTRDLIETLYDPDYQKKIRSAFVQDFGGREWGSYADRWIDIGQAFLVLDSDKFGAMGPTIATFGAQAEAEAFAAENGGTVMTFGELDEAKFEVYQKRVRQLLRDITQGVQTEAGAETSPDAEPPHGHD